MNGSAHALVHASFRTNKCTQAAQVGRQNYESNCLKGSVAAKDKMRQARGRRAQIGRRILDVLQPNTQMISKGNSSLDRLSLLRLFYNLIQTLKRAHSCL
jgi:hypothetical protein